MSCRRASARTPGATSGAARTTRRTSSLWRGWAEGADSRCRARRGGRRGQRNRLREGGGCEAGDAELCLLRAHTRWDNNATVCCCTALAIGQQQLPADYAPARRPVKVDPDRAASLFLSARDGVSLACSVAKEKPRGSLSGLDIETIAGERGKGGEAQDGLLGGKCTAMIKGPPLHELAEVQGRSRGSSRPPFGGWFSLPGPAPNLLCQAAEHMRRRRREVVPERRHTFQTTKQRGAQVSELR